MIQLLSLAMFATVLMVAIMTIVATIKAEMTHIVRALGANGVAMPPLRSTRAPRARITRRPRAMDRASLRAAA